MQRMMKPIITNSQFKKHTEKICLAFQQTNHTSEDSKNVLFVQLFSNLASKHSIRIVNFQFCLQPLIWIFQNAERIHKQS